MRHPFSTVASIITLVFFYSACSSATDAGIINPPLDSEKFSFIVAGHTYGAHFGKNIGLYPKFHDSMLKQDEYDFLVLTGDFIRNKMKENYDSVLADLDELSKPYYLVMGNHDNSDIGRMIFNEKYGATYYSFSIRQNLFVFLDSQIRRYAISDEQLRFLEEQLKNRTYSNVFIYFHELLWLNYGKYNDLTANYNAPKYYKTNFWQELFPLFLQHADTRFYVTAGDVGGNPHSIPAFYDRIGNVTLVASGMGEVEDENYLKIEVDREKVKMTVFPLWDKKPARPVEWYNVENMRNRFTHCVYPKCVLPRPSHKPGLWDRILKYLGCKCAG